MRLTKKEYWETGWKNMQLPASFLDDYSHRVISKKFLETIRGLNIKPEKIIELGGCPGRWPDFFSKNFSCVCDALDYGENNCEITRKNFELLGISGNIYNQDLFDNTLAKESYDVVISDGLVEHFETMGEVFGKHCELVKKGGLLIVGVPNIKQSSFYDYFAKKDPVGYAGYRAVEKKELIDAAVKYGLKIKFCGYLGVINLGLVGWGFVKNKYAKHAVSYFLEAVNRILKIIRIKKESKIFSPYIYLIARKNED